MVTKRRQCNGSRRRQSTASVIETRFTEALRRISRVATREPIVPVRPFKIREKSSLLWFRSSQSQSRPETRRKEKFPFFSRTRRARDRRGQCCGLTTKNFSARVGNIGQRFPSRSPRGAPFQSAVARRRVEKTRAEDRFLVSRVRWPARKRNER